MQEFFIDSKESMQDFEDMLAKKEVSIARIEGSTVHCTLNGESVKLTVEKDYLQFFIDKAIIFGKDFTPHIINISHKDNKIHVFFEGVKEPKVFPWSPWALSPKPLKGTVPFAGNQHFKHFLEFDSYEDYQEKRSRIYELKLYTCWNQAESFMLRHGMTYFKDMTIKDVSVLSFDIETDGLHHTDNSKVFIISNTFRKGDYYERRVFNLKDYEDDCGRLITDWCAYVVCLDPSIMLAHNGIGFDLPYLDHVARCYGVELTLGKDGSSIHFEERVSKFRKDGSQNYEYHNPVVFGREVIDTFFLAIKYDIGRKYESYGLKSIIRQEGLEKEGRTFIDASQISKYYNDPEMWPKVVTYAEEDSDDSLKLFDLMGPSIFYFTQSIPMTFQQVNNKATGSQINSFLVRSYLQNGESIPLADKLPEHTEGGISFAVPGIYRNLIKWDLKSAYPSQVLRFQLYDKKKDPKAHFYRMVRYFTYERFDLKKKYKETKDKYYSDREQSSKIFINSAYGVTITNGLNFNAPWIGAKITKETRDVLNQAITWASGKDKDYWIAEFNRKVGKEDV